MAEPKKKNIFDQVIDAVTNRDEKAAAEAARLEAAAKAEAQARANMSAQQKAAADAKAAAEAQVAAAAKAAAEAKAKADAVIAARAAEAQRQAELERQAMLKAEQERRAADAAAQARAALPHHKVAANDTLSAIALKFYGHAAEPYWRLIYEANKEAIGSNPGVIRPGTELVIPVLPPELKK